MENFNAIDLHQSRDFSRKMNATFEFIRQNFKSLCKSILFIAGPPVLIASMLAGTFMSDIMDFSQGGMANPDMLENYFMSVSFWLQIGLMMLFFLVSGVMTLATINNYIILYSEKKTNNIAVAEVWERVRSSFWVYLGTVFMFALLAVVVYVILLVPFALIVAISPFLVFLGVLLLMGALIYLVVSVSLTFFIRSYEKKNFFEAISRSYKLVQGKWWSTFGLVMILYLVMATISYFFLIPYYVIMVVEMLHNTKAGVVGAPSATLQTTTIIFFTLYYLVQMILNTLPNIGIAFQYFNLVELKEARGLISQIDSIGQAQEPQTSEEHY